MILGVLPYYPPVGINPAELTTFGLMNDYEEENVREIIRALLDQGYLEKDDKGILKLNKQSEKILFNKQRAAMRRRPQNRGNIKGEDLFQALQKLRYEIASKEYIAASALFSDSTLRDLCRILPKDKKQLAAVDGMGVFKANFYGDQILRVIRLFSPTTLEKSKEKKHTSNGMSAKDSSFAAYKDKVIGAGHTEAYQPWTKEEDQQLIREYESGKTTKELSEIHKRTGGAVRSRLKKLKLI